MFNPFLNHDSQDFQDYHDKNPGNLLILKIPVLAVIGLWQ